MPMDIITSASNKLIKNIRALGTKKGRDAQGLFLAEGAKFVAEINSGWEVVHKIARRGFECASDSTIIVDDKIFDTLTDVVSPQGSLFVVRKKQYTFDDVFKNPNPLVFLL